MLQTACWLLRNHHLYFLLLSYRAKVFNFWTPQARVPVAHKPPPVLSPAGTMQKHFDTYCSCAANFEVFAVNSRVLGEVAGVSAFLCPTPELIPGALLGEEGAELWQDRAQHSFLTREWVCTHGELLQSSVFWTGNLLT